MTEEYKLARKNCHWIPRKVNAEDGMPYFKYNYYASEADYRRFRPTRQLRWTKGKFDSNFPQEKFALTCDVGVTIKHIAPNITNALREGLDIKNTVLQVPEEQQGWRIMRFGPLRMFGGTDRHELQGYDVLGFSEDFQRQMGLPVQVTQQIHWVVDAEGAPVHQPPVQLHHSRLYPTPWEAFPNKNVISAEYSDSACEDLGYANSSDCHMQGYPDGWGIPIDQPLGWDAEISDVRPAGAPPMTLYIEVGVRFTNRRLTPATVATLHHPWVFSLSGAGVKNAAFYAPANGTAVQFYTGVFSDSGTMLRAQFHAQPRHTEALWLLRGTLEDLGLSKAPFNVNKDRPWIPFYPEMHGMLIDDVKVYLTKRLKVNQRAGEVGIPPLPTLECLAERSLWYNRTYIFSGNNSSGNKTGDDNITDFLDPSDTWSEPMGKPWDRAFEVECFGEWAFRQGDPFTVVGFFRPQCADGCADAAELHPDGVPQQAIVHLTYTDINAASQTDMLRPWTLTGSQDVHRFRLAGRNVFDGASTFPGLKVTDTLLSLMQGGYPPDESSKKALNMLQHAAGVLHPQLSKRLASQAFNPYDDIQYASIPQFVHTLLSPYKGAIYDGGAGDGYEKPMPTAPNAGRLMGKEDIFVKKAVKKYIDFCRWKERAEERMADTSEGGEGDELSQGDDDEGEDEEDEGGDDEEDELLDDDFNLTDEEEEERDARLERQGKRKLVEEFDEREKKLTKKAKREPAFVAEKQVS
ncbi:hypothetical protein CYMTET_18976 [Cymbomonas tetramitiformis]|uniref:Uncharacterized protein n=1 Tax=Cymbomonas tetramitiformis TaxID=36881 RepID=A0AAE0G708_9CHLO|nr:hypothetical protein CYMTET_18976 [Cymbomonas tetramitiformis]